MLNTQINLHKDNYENIDIAWSGDLWDRNRLGLQLERYVDRLQCGAVLALDARWGEGKTWFVRNWKRHLETTEIPHNVIYLDAFANDYLDDPFLVITSEISNILKKDKSTKRRVKKLIELSASVGTTLLPSLPKVALTLGLHLVGAGLVSGVLQQGYESAKDGIDTLSEEASDRIKESIQNKIANHEAEKNTLLDFKKHLSETVDKLDKPLVFIIDELDRCRPDFAIRLIERIKHFFDIPKIVFVLVVHKDNLKKIINTHYGYENINEDYLDKFIDFSIPLPQISYPGNDFYLHYEKIAQLLKQVGVYSDDICFTFYMSQHRQYKTARELKKVINQFALLKQDRKSDMFLIVALMQGAHNLEEKMINIFYTFLNGHEPMDSLNVLKSLSTRDFKNFENKIESKFNYKNIKILSLIKALKEAETQGDQNDVLLGYNLYGVDGGEEEFSSQFKNYIEHNLY